MKIEDIVVGERYWTHIVGDFRATPFTCLGVGEELVIAVNHDTGSRLAIEPECFICAQQPRWWEFWKKKPKAVFDVKDREEELRQQAMAAMPSKEALQKLIQESPPPVVVDTALRPVVLEIPFGKWPNVRDVNVEELRKIQEAVLNGGLFTRADLQLIDACISFVIRNAKRK